MKFTITFRCCGGNHCLFCHPILYLLVASLKSYNCMIYWRFCFSNDNPLLIEFSSFNRRISTGSLKFFRLSLVLKIQNGDIVTDRLEGQGTDKFLKFPTLQRWILCILNLQLLLRHLKYLNPIFNKFAWFQQKIHSFFH